LLLDRFRLTHGGPKRQERREDSGMAGTVRPLDGLFVLDLGQMRRGPHAGFPLGMAGPAVAEAEPPGTARRGAGVPAAMLR
jgi:crotonobetainyl-CoA:carnitine CoA-transferase CaiB-like acyl-CoA transferase